MDEPALFEITPDERVAKARRHLEDALERAEKRIEKAEAKAADAQAELDEFDAAIAAVRGDGE